jgi:ribosomal protein S18 acetylase RimI-like enzyme
MKVSIRRATTADLEAVQHLNQKLFLKESQEFDPTLKTDRPFSKEGETHFTKRASGEEGIVFVAVLNEHVIGYVCGGPTKSDTYREKRTVAELENLYVLKEYRMKGIGQQLYEAFLAWCGEKGINKVVVEASSENVTAINFYRKVGFKDYSLVMEHDL